MDNSGHFQRAFLLHEQGKLAEAQFIYLQILTRDPGHPGALHHLGIIALQQNQPVEAVKLIEMALVHTPDNVAALKDLGTALSKLQRWETALASYDRALALKPDFAEVFYNRAIALFRLERWEEALASYDRALEITPEYPEALTNRGVLLLGLARLDEALSSIEQALALRPKYAAAWNSHGDALVALRRWDEAVASYDRALSLRPAFADAFYNRGNALLELKRFDDACASYDRAIVLKPDYVEALANRGSALLELKRLDEALASYDCAIAFNADLAEVFCNRGTVLVELKRLDEALASYGKALEIRPDYAEAHWNESRCRLLGGDFPRGWEKYEWRWRVPPLNDSQRQFSSPLWLGQEDIAGKTLLFHAEQGLGDTIQFCRYAPLAAARGAKAVLEVPRGLAPLLSSLDGVTQIVANGEPLPPIDFHCPLMSLPLALKTTVSTIPAQVPYLKPASDLIAKWRATLSATKRPWIGLAWSGAPTHRRDQHRSIGVQHLAPLLAREASFFSLQKDYRTEDRQWMAAHPQIVDAGQDFANTAALISLMDLVITVDTSIAHLAGALGAPVWIMLPRFGLDWRWMLEREDSPWYPTARLYRQPAIDGWEDVVARIAHDLQDFAS